MCIIAFTLYRGWIWLDNHQLSIYIPFKQPQVRRNKGTNEKYKVYTMNPPIDIDSHRIHFQNPESMVVISYEISWRSRTPPRKKHVVDSPSTWFLIVGRTKKQQNHHWRPICFMVKRTKPAVFTVKSILWGCLSCYLVAFSAEFQCLTVRPIFQQAWANSCQLSLGSRARSFEQCPKMI